MVTEASGPMKFAVGTIVKNEASSLLEWVAYHRVVGLDHLIIADNMSTDATWPMLKALQKQGVLTTFRFPTLGERAPQLLAYKRIARLAKGRYTAVAYIDADEYLVPMDGSHSIKPYLIEWFSAPEVGAVALNWACFGSGGAVFRTEGLVIERFTQRFAKSRGQNKHYKSIVRPEWVEKFLNPHQVGLTQGRYLNAQGKNMVPDEAKPYGLSAEVIWEPVRINHYVVKSLEEYLVRKSPMGSAARFGKVKHQKFFISHDRNDETCKVAADMSETVKAEMARLQALIEQDLAPCQLEQAKDSAGRWLSKKLDRIRRWRLNQ